MEQSSPTDGAPALSDENAFWRTLDALAATHRLVIDRPRGSAHPRYPETRYPFDYGYLESTTAGDGDGIDVWVGTLGGGAVTAVIVTVDLLKRDGEIKVLVGCTPEEQQIILATHREGAQAATLLARAAPPLPREWPT